MEVSHNQYPCEFCGKLTSRKRIYRRPSRRIRYFCTYGCEFRAQPKGLFFGGLFFFVWSVVLTVFLYNFTPPDYRAHFTFLALAALFVSGILLGAIITLSGLYGFLTR